MGLILDHPSEEANETSATGLPVNLRRKRVLRGCYFSLMIVHFTYFLISWSNLVSPLPSLSHFLSSIPINNLCSISRKKLNYGHYCCTTGSSQLGTLSLLWFKLFLTPLCLLWLIGCQLHVYRETGTKDKATSLPGLPPSLFLPFLQKKPVWTKFLWEASSNSQLQKYQEDLEAACAIKYFYV